ncbi:MAG: CheR family methyltransferase [archaeon]
MVKIKSELKKEQLDLLRVANHTGFFRDKFVWDTLEKEVIPKIMKVKCELDFFDKGVPFKELKLQQPLSVLVIGCSSGCEVYSIGIVLKEMNISCVIDAIDVDAQRIEEAKKGVFDADQLVGVSSKRQKQFFNKIGNQHQIKKDLFNINFVAVDAFNFLAETKLDEFKASVAKHCYDLVFCRNVFHYYDAKGATELLNQILNCTSLNGYLVFGTDDSVPNHQDIKLEYVSERIFRAFGESIIGHSEKTYKKAQDNWYATRVFTGVFEEQICENKIVGIGSAGLNIIGALKKQTPKNFSLIGADTNICPLLIASNYPWICFGRKLIRGFGCGGSIKVAQEMIKEGIHELTDFIQLNKTKKLFIVTGGGGATGMISTEALANEAHNRGIPVCVVITKPFALEKIRVEKFDKLIGGLVKKANLTIVLELENLKDKKTDAVSSDLFRKADELVSWIVVALIENKINIADYSKEQARIEFINNEVFIKIKETKILVPSN